MHSTAASAILGNSQGYMVGVSTGNQQFYTQHGSWEPDAGGGW